MSNVETSIPRPASLGIDPGSRVSGYGVVSGGACLAAGVVKASSGYLHLLNLRIEALFVAGGDLSPWRWSFERIGIERPPVRARRDAPYDPVMPSVAAGLWIGALFRNHAIKRQPAWVAVRDWRRVVLGPKRSWKGPDQTTAEAAKIAILDWAEQLWSESGIDVQAEGPDRVDAAEATAVAWYLDQAEAEAELETELEASSSSSSTGRPDREQTRPDREQTDPDRAQKPHKPQQQRPRPRPSKPRKPAQKPPKPDKPARPGRGPRRKRKSRPRQ